MKCCGLKLLRGTPPHPGLCFVFLVSCFGIWYFVFRAEGFVSRVSRFVRRVSCFGILRFVFCVLCFVFRVSSFVFRVSCFGIWCFVQRVSCCGLRVREWSGFEAGSYLRLIDFEYHSTLGLRVIKKKKRRFWRAPRRGLDLLLVLLRQRVFVLARPHHL